MGLSLRIAIIPFLIGATSLAPAPKVQEPQAPQLQTDLCELLRDEHEDLLNTYPNEYYDCHAHSRYLKISSAPADSDRKAS